MAIPPYPSVPAPSTYADGPMLVSELRADVTNGVSFLANRPSFSAYCTGTPAIVAGGYRSVVLDTETFDTWAGHSPLGSSPQNYYCQAPGYYIGEGYVPWQYTTATQRQFAAGLGVNTVAGLTTYAGQDHLSASGIDPGVFAADLFQMTRTGAPGSAGADYVQLQALTTATGPLLAGSGAEFPRLSVRWAGTGAASSLAVPSNAAFPVPPADVTPGWLNANISQAISFLSNPPLFRYYLNGAGSLASGTWPAAGAVTLDTKTVDNYTAWNAGAQHWVVPQPGVYWIAAGVGVDVSLASAAAYAAGVTIAGSTTWGNAVYAAADTGPDTLTAGLCGRFRLTAGQAVSLAGFQSTGGTLTLGAGTKLAIAWESS